MFYVNLFKEGTKGIKKANFVQNWLPLKIVSCLVGKSFSTSIDFGVITFIKNHH
jgi:hypothetical protein